MDGTASPERTRYERVIWNFILKRASSKSKECQERNERYVVTGKTEETCATQRLLYDLSA